MTVPSTFHHSTQTCPKCRRRLYQSLQGAAACSFCQYQRPPPAGSAKVGLHGRGNIDRLRSELERLTQRIKIGQLATLFDSGSHLALEWSLQLEVDLTHYSCGARMAECSHVIVIGEPKRPIGQITQGIPYRHIRT